MQRRRENARARMACDQQIWSSGQRRQQQTTPMTVYQYTMLQTAAALARATVAHLVEALREREHLGGDATGDLVSVLLDAHMLSDALAQLAAREGGAPWAK